MAGPGLAAPHRVTLHRGTRTDAPRTGAPRTGPDGPGKADLKDQKDLKDPLDQKDGSDHPPGLDLRERLVEDAERGFRLRAREHERRRQADRVLAAPSTSRPR